MTAYRYEPHLDALLMALNATSRTTVIDLYAIDVSDLLAVVGGSQANVSKMIPPSNAPLALGSRFPPARW